MLGKKSFILYSDILHTVKKLNNTQAGKLFKYILEYVNDENPKIDDLAVDLVFEPIKQNLKREKESYIIGEKHWNWKGGISKLAHKIRNSTSYRHWRKSILKRDNYICQRCNKTPKKIHVHHIKKFCDYPDERFNINNGITLCKKCHINLHKKEK